MNQSLFYSIINVLVFLGVFALTAQALIGLSFLVSCLWEKEKRAAAFAALQFFGMTALLSIYFLLSWSGFFNTTTGVVILCAGYVIVLSAVIFMVRRTEPNQKALQGTKGYFMGEVERFDERMQVFARNRSLPPGSEQYIQFYKEHPGLEQYDAQRRERGGPLGQIGLIDRPHESPNVAATLASLSIPLNLSHPRIVKPNAHPLLKGKHIHLSPQEATLRVKGYATNIP